MKEGRNIGGKKKRNVNLKSRSSAIDSRQVYSGLINNFDKKRYIEWVNSSIRQFFFFSPFPAPFFSHIEWIGEKEKRRISDVYQQ